MATSIRSYQTLGHVNVPREWLCSNVIVCSPKLICCLAFLHINPNWGGGNLSNITRQPQCSWEAGRPNRQLRQDFWWLLLFRGLSSIRTGIRWEKFLIELGLSVVGLQHLKLQNPRPVHSKSGGAHQGKPCGHVPENRLSFPAPRPELYGEVRTRLC
jgi:hypothetical protein